jgi:hypothetical protein
MENPIIKCTIQVIDKIICLFINKSYSNINDIKNWINRFKEINNKNATIDDTSNENNFIVKIPLSKDETSENSLDVIVPFLLWFNIFRSDEIQEL